MNNGPKILAFDIETAPMLGYIWGLWGNDVALNQVTHDWHVLSWSATWVVNNKPTKIMYEDQRKVEDISNDKDILKSLHKLIESADILVTHAGKRFDIKKLNARFVYHRLNPIVGYKHIDTLEIAKRQFNFTSNKLEYLAKYLKVGNKKMQRKEFSGFELWSECLKRNKKAWVEMELYNKQDVAALVDVYNVLNAWGVTPSHSNYYDTDGHVCGCGYKGDQPKAGFYITQLGKYQKYRCPKCGKITRDSENLISKEKRNKIKRVIT